MTNVLRVFLCVYYLYLFDEMFLRIFCLFLIKVVCILIKLREFLCSPLSDMHYVHIFSQYAASFFIFRIVFYVAETFHFG